MSTKMHIICAWCLPGIAHINNEPTTHGICPRCMDELWASTPMTKIEVMNQQPAPERQIKEAA